MSADELVFNGIDGRDGSYLLPPLHTAALAQVAMGQRLPTAELDELQLKLGQEFDYPLKESIDPDDLSQAGWAVVFPFVCKASAAARRQASIRDALAPLLDYRRSQASRTDERRYRDCVGPSAYRPGETKQQFLARMGAGSGPVDPKQFPYYLLLVGSPEEIPYRVQYQLDVQYAVGRIHFDTVDEYAHYARSVVAAETSSRRRSARAAFFGVANPDDRATRASARQLVAPMADFVERELAGVGWQVERFLGDAASKARLCRLFGDDAPGFLFTASHGVGFPPGDPRQRAVQGALLCQDWGGPRAGSLTPDHYLCGDDIATSADLRGLIGFHFACFGAGTPKHDDFVRRTLGEVAPIDIAPLPFLARLPQRMLGKPDGALAYIGHVDRAWGSSFLQANPRASGTDSAQLAVFESTLQRLLEGHRVGYAMDYFDIRYAELASDLAARVEEIQHYPVDCDDDELASLWMYASDARNYAVIGDPAVRLQTAAEPCDPMMTLEQRSGERAPLSLGCAPELHESPAWWRPDEQAPGAVLGSAEPDGAGPAGAADAAWEVADVAPAVSAVAPAGYGELAGAVATALCRAAAAAIVLDVRTFAAPRAGSAPRIHTRTDAGGQTSVCVAPDRDGRVDPELWRLHLEVMTQARRDRRDILQLALSLLPDDDA